MQNKNVFAAVALIMIEMYAGGALAQKGTAGAIDEIIVTARKRAESLQTVPQAITVLNAADLRALGATLSSDVALHTPNLMWHSILGFSTPNIFLRGIGSTTFNANQANPVGLHVDDVYQGSTLSYGFGLLDLERVEIIKGPQGTLFGRNTTGGVINFISRKPDPAAGLNGSTTLTYGRFNQADVNGALGFALSDRAAVRVAAQTLNRDGYVANRNPASGITRQGKAEIWSGRAQGRLIDASDFDILLNVHGGKNHSDIIPGKQVGILCPPGISTPTLARCSDFFGFRDTTNFRESFTNIPSFDNVDTWGAGGTITWAGWAGMTAVSQTQYESNHRRLTNDSDAGPAAAIKTNVLSHFHQFNQEFRASSDPGESLAWIVGGNYYSDMLNAFQNFALNAFGPGALSRFFPVEEGIASRLLQRTKSTAAFGEANYKLNPRLTATLGLRWTQDRRTAETNSFIFDARGLSRSFITEQDSRARLLFPTIPALTRARQWSEWSGRGVFSYNAFENGQVYAGVARGFKGGDFNGGALFAPAEANISNPEFVTSYEVGFKAANAERTITIDSSAFYYDFTDQQVSVLLPGSNATLQALANAAKTRSQGVELDLTAAPSAQTFIELKAGLLDAKFVRFQQDPRNPATNYAGNRTASSPKLSLSAIGRYTIPVADGALVPQLDATFTGAHFYTVDNNPALRQNGYWLINSRLTYAADTFSVAIWAKNLANKKYTVSGLGNVSFGFLEIFPGLPRTFGLTVSGGF